MNLFNALSEGKTSELVKLIEKNPERIFEKNEAGLSFIMMVCYYRNHKLVELIKVLDKQISDPFELCALGMVPELKAALHHHPELIKSISPDGFQLLGYACFFGHEEMVTLLISLGADINKPSANTMKVCPLHSAVSNQNKSIVEKLLKNGADPNLPQQQGILPVHQAAHSGNEEILSLLAEYGADLSLKSDDGKGIDDYRVNS